MHQNEYLYAGSMENLSPILSDFKTKNAFLVTGKKSYTDCGANSFIRSIPKIKFTKFNDFNVNPVTEDINKGLELFNKSCCDTIIAIGGGSAIDIAKVIRYASERDFGKFSISEINKLGTSAIKKQIPLIAIPTTAGSGSEATKFAVLYENKTKYSLDDISILPNAVILDPNLCLSLSPYNTAVTGLDALCHSIESYWCINSTEESKSYARQAITLIMENLKMAVNSPTLFYRLKMLQAANLAGKAINITRTTASHAISYTLTSYFSIPHGLAVCLTLPELLEYNSQIKDIDNNDKRGTAFVIQSIREIIKLLGTVNVQNAKNILTELMQSIGLSEKLSSYEIKNSDLELIINNINIERLNNNPRKLTKEAVAAILQQIL